MLIKICGTTNLEDALLSVKLGADALGFILAPSPRQVTPEQIVEITSHLPSRVLRIGVFTEPDAAYVAHVQRVAALQAVQMHWPYHSEVIDDLRAALPSEVQLWQVVGVPVDGKQFAAERTGILARLQTALQDPRLAMVLLDAVKNKRSGGLGQSFPWSETATLLREASRSREARTDHGQQWPRLMLAGGLHAGNVQEAMTTLSPWGVDVVSGVESSPGVKDSTRLASFIDAARTAVTRS